jgi:hypothetical protein
MLDFLLRALKVCKFIVLNKNHFLKAFRKRFRVEKFYKIT